MAPEILREGNSPRGSPKGDVYSFAIILQEVLYRAKPYEVINSVGVLNKGKYGHIIHDIHVFQEYLIF